MGLGSDSCQREGEFWVALKWGYHGLNHHMSAKHVYRYVNEFAGRNNFRGLDTIDQTRMIARRLDRNPLRYNDFMR